MPLVDLNLPVDEGTMGRDVRVFVREAERRIERFQRTRPIPAFVPSDFARVYGLLRGLAAAELAPARLFCEWGSGFGVVADLAAMLDFDACGIEVEGELVQAARQLADDFGLPVEFAHGSFIPKGAACVNSSAEFAWLTQEGASGQEELGLDPDDFNVIFAYPWPDEERLTEELFERYASVGAVLVTYHGGEVFRVRRKTRARSGRP